jgi:hypothetical protein
MNLAIGASGTDVLEHALGDGPELNVLAEAAEQLFAQS